LTISTGKPVDQAAPWFRCTLLGCRKASPT
jgi:hypothetical protein